MTPLVSAIAGLLLTLPTLNAATFVTTGVYDEPVNTNAVDLTAAASNITLAAFTTAVSTAFASDLGGVIDFETAANLPATLSFTASYGVSQTSELTITSGTTGRYNSNTNNPVISGSRYLGIDLGTVTQTFLFSTPIETVGITALYRAATQTITPTLYFASAPTTPVPLASFVMNAANTDTFFGYTSPSDPIVRLDLPVAAGSGNAFIRVDDLGFIAVPEPTSMALGIISGLGMLGLMRRRRA